MISRNDGSAAQVIRPSVLVQKFAHLRRLNVKGIFTDGGVTSPPQTPYDVSQELYSELIRGRVPDPDAFFLETARRWCEGNAQAAAQLVEAWKAGDKAIGALHLMNWYHAGAGQTQGRWLTRPLVPDITRLNPQERRAWERELFTLPWDIGRQNISFEGGIRMYSNEQLEEAVRNYDSAVIPGLSNTVGLLDQAITQTGDKAVLVDQRDRYLGFLLSVRTVRNLFDAQVAVNKCLLGKSDPAAERRRLTAAIEAEIENTREWLRFLGSTKTEVFRVTEGRETPFLYKTPVKDLALKLEAMQNHLNDRPGPFLKELTEPHSARKLLYYSENP